MFGKLLKIIMSLALTLTLGLGLAACNQQQKNAESPKTTEENAAVQATAFFNKVEAKYVCMVNNKLFDKVQIPVEFEGKTYYGCCEGCKTNLQVKAELRVAEDPLTGETVDKASALIAAMPDGQVLYFANENNFSKFKGLHS